MHKVSPWLLLVIGALMAADQFTKLVIRSSLEVGHSVRVAPFLRISHIENRGMAFGMLGDHTGLIIFVGAAVVLILVVAVMAAMHDHEVFWSLALLIAGASGNLLDRLFRGSVTDFIHLSFWPAFNLADIYIVVGVLLLIRVLIFRHHHEEGRER